MVACFVQHLLLFQIISMTEKLFRARSTTEKLFRARIVFLSGGRQSFVNLPLQ